MGLRKLLARFKDELAAASLVEPVKPGLLEEPEEPESIGAKAAFSAVTSARIASNIEADNGKRRPGFHVSNMWYFCPRRFLLDLYFPENKVTKVTPEDVKAQRIYNIGHFVHALYQDTYLGPEQVLEGGWKCRMCLHKAVGFMPEMCGICSAPQSELTYLEPRVDFDFGLGAEHWLTGNCDGILHLSHRPEPGTLEIKSIKPENFKGLVGPQPAHLHQATLYMHLLKLKWGVVVYFCKSTGEEKIFEIEHTPQPWWDVEGKIGSIKRWVRRAESNGGKADPRWLRETRGRCSSRESWWAQRCHQVDACFSILGAGKGAPCSSASVVAESSLKRSGKRLTVVRE